MMFERYEYSSTDIFIDGWLTALMNKLTQTCEKSIITSMEDDFVVVNPQRRFNISHDDVYVDLFNIHSDLHTHRLAQMKLRSIIRRLNGITYDNFNLVENLIGLTFHLPWFHRAKVALLISFLES